MSCAGFDLDVVALAFLLVRTVAEHAVEDLDGDRHESRVGDPGAVEAVAGFPLLVLPHLGERHLVDGRVAARRDEGRHAADGVRAAAVAGLHQELGVVAHERHGHRDLRPVGQRLALAVAERLDRAEDVVPAAGVETGGVVAQLVEDLIHLEGGGQRFDQHRRPHRAAGDAEGILGVGEDVVPEPRLAVALQLGQIEVGTRAAVDQLLGVVEKIEPEIEQAAGDRLAVDGHVAFVEMPAAGPDEEGRGFGVQRVLAPIRVLEGDRAAHRVVEVSLAVDDVAPGRRRGVLQIGHEDLGPGVEGVDDHLAVAGAGDLDPAIEEIAGAGATCQFASRTARVSGRKSSSAPASIAVWRSSRARSSSWRRGLKRR